MKLYKFISLKNLVVFSIEWCELKFGSSSDKLRKFVLAKLKAEHWSKICTADTGLLQFGCCSFISQYLWLYAVWPTLSMVIFVWSSRDQTNGDFYRWNLIHLFFHEISISTTFIYYFACSFISSLISFYSTKLDT